MSQIPDLRRIPVDRILPSRFQAREMFDEEELKKLAQSVKEVGQSQPVRVRPCAAPADASSSDGDPWFELVGGERRVRAAKMIGLKEILAICEELSDEEAALKGMAENEQAQSLNPIERAKGYRELMNRFHLKQEEVAAKVGLSGHASVSRYLSLLEEPAQIQEWLKRGELHETHCRVLGRIRDPKKRVVAARKIVSGSLSAQKAGKLVDKFLGKRVLAKTKSSKRPTARPTTPPGTDYGGFWLSWSGDEVAVWARNFRPDKDVLRQYADDLVLALEGFLRNEPKLTSPLPLGEGRGEGKNITREPEVVGTSEELTDSNSEPSTQEISALSEMAKSPPPDMQIQDAVGGLISDFVGGIFGLPKKPQ